MSRPAPARILCRTGDHAGATYELGMQATLGRGSANDIVLESPVLSTRHARVYMKDGEYWVEDMGSLNGTRLDGVPVAESMRLDRLHVITLADKIDLVFVRPEGAVPPVSSAAPRAQPQATRTPPAAAPPPQPAAAPPPQPSEPRTVLESSGFEALPELGKKKEKQAPPPEAPAAQTRIQGGFDALPDLRPEPADEGRTQVRADFGATGAGQTEEPEPAPATFELHFALPGKGLQTVALEPGETTLGRSDDCDIVIQDSEKRISRKHATLRVDENGITLTDLNSANGTFFQGEKIQSVSLAPGASFQLGPELEFTILQR